MVVPADLPVQSGDLLLSLVQSPTSMFAALVDDEANMTWAEQTPFRGFYMKPWGPGEFVWYDYSLAQVDSCGCVVHHIGYFNPVFCP